MHSGRWTTKQLHFNCLKFKCKIFIFCKVTLCGLKFSFILRLQYWMCRNVVVFAWGFSIKEATENKTTIKMSGRFSFKMINRNNMYSSVVWLHESVRYSYSHSIWNNSRMFKQKLRSLKWYWTQCGTRHFLVLIGQQSSCKSPCVAHVG